MDKNENNPKGLPSKEEIMLALTTLYNGELDFLDDVNRITFGLISKRTNHHGNSRPNYR